MKLVYCLHCNHVFSLTSEKVRTCDCGRVSGRYCGSEYAEVNGNGVSLAIGNGSLMAAIHQMRRILESGEAVNRDTFLNGSRVTYCWVRPHEGPGNPHTMVIRETCEPKSGDRGVCVDCGEVIEFVGPYWKHVGTNPRHNAVPFLFRREK